MPVQRNFAGALNGPKGLFNPPIMEVIPKASFVQEVYLHPEAKYIYSYVIICIYIYILYYSHILWHIQCISIAFSSNMTWTTTWTTRAALCGMSQNGLRWDLDPERVVCFAQGEWQKAYDMGLPENSVTLDSLVHHHFPYQKDYMPVCPIFRQTQMKMDDKGWTFNINSLQKPMLCPQSTVCIWDQRQAISKWWSFTGSQARWMWPAWT